MEYIFISNLFYRLAVTFFNFPFIDINSKLATVKNVGFFNKPKGSVTIEKCLLNSFHCSILIVCIFRGIQLIIVMENNFSAFKYTFLLIILKLYGKHNRYQESNYRPEFV